MNGRNATNNPNTAIATIASKNIINSAISIKIPPLTSKIALIIVTHFMAKNPLLFSTLWKTKLNFYTNKIFIYTYVMKKIKKKWAKPLQTA